MGYITLLQKQNIFLGEWKHSRSQKDPIALPSWTDHLTTESRSEFGCQLFDHTIGLHVKDMLIQRFAGHSWIG